MWQEAGFLKGNSDIDVAMKKLGHYIEIVPAIFNAMTEPELLQFPAPGKWSRKQILGHLVDSAINNLKRFTDIQFLPQPYVVIAYSQNELVAVNNYQQVPLDHLIQLWQSLNQQIILIVENIPAEKFQYRVKTQYQNNEMQILEWLICDYVAHMEHHHKQLS